MWADASVRAHLQTLSNAMTETEINRILGDAYGLKEDIVRQRLVRMRASGKLDGLWSRTGTGRVMYGPTEVFPAAGTQEENR